MEYDFSAIGALLGPLAGILMAGAAVVDSLPHGSFFHAADGAVNMSIEPENDTYGIPQRQQEIAEICTEVLTTVHFLIYTNFARLNSERMTGVPL